MSYGESVFFEVFDKLLFVRITLSPRLSCHAVNKFTIRIILVYFSVFEYFLIDIIDPCIEFRFRCGRGF